MINKYHQIEYAYISVDGRNKKRVLVLFVDGVDVGVESNQNAGNVGRGVHAGGAQQRSPAVEGDHVGVGSVVEHPLEGGQVAAVDGVEHGRHAGNVLELVRGNGGYIVAEFLDEVDAAIECGYHQRCLAALVLRVHVRSVFEQNLKYSSNPKFHDLTFFQQIFSSKIFTRSCF
jgi:hypothetical protein